VNFQIAGLDLTFGNLYSLVFIDGRRTNHPVVFTGCKRSNYDGAYFLYFTDTNPRFYGAETGYTVSSVVIADEYPTPYAEETRPVCQDCGRTELHFVC